MAPTHYECARQKAHNLPAIFFKTVGTKNEAYAVACIFCRTDKTSKARIYPHQEPGSSPWFDQDEARTEGALVEKEYLEKWYEAADVPDELKAKVRQWRRAREQRFVHDHESAKERGDILSKEEWKCFQEYTER